jgi:hypothetical protein
MADDANRVDGQWACLLETADPAVRLMAEAALGQPMLRRLFPYQSMSRLRFSRTMDYPYDPFPYIRKSHEEESYFEVRDANNRVMFSGPLAAAVVVLADAMSRALAP